MNRKIKLPDHLCAPTMLHRGGDKDCDHDYPPETECSHNDTVEWYTCAKCGMRTGFEVYD